MSNSNLLILIYKGKLLLYSQDVFYQETTNNIWNFFNKEALKKIGMMKLSIENIAPSISLAKLSDVQVNSISRQDGIRVEFYKFDEVKDLTLSVETKSIIDNYKDAINQYL